MYKQAVVLFYSITAVLHPGLGYIIIKKKKVLSKIEEDYAKTEKQ